MSALARSLLARGTRPLHPIHALLLAFVFPSLLGTWFSDLAYGASYEVQWSNFAAWLIIGALVGGGFALLWALIDMIRDRTRRTARHAIYATLLAVTWAVAFIDELVHSQDAGAIMPEAPWLSFFAALLALVASWIGFSGLRAGDAS